jgi:TPR repeat protein
LAQDLQGEILRLDDDSRKAKAAVIALHEQALALIDGAAAAMIKTLRDNAGAVPPLRPADLTLIQDAATLIQSERLAAADRLHRETWAAFAQALNPEPRSLKELARRLGPFRAGLARYRPALEALAAEPLRTPAFAQARNDMIRMFAEAHDAGAALDAAASAGDEASFVIVLHHVARVSQYRQAVTERGVALVAAAEAALDRLAQRFGSAEAADAYFAEVRRAGAVAREIARLRAAVWSSLAGLDAADPARPAGGATGPGGALAASFADAARMADATASAAIAVESTVQSIDGHPRLFASGQEPLTRLYRGVEARFAAAAEAVAGASERGIDAARKADALLPADRAAAGQAFERTRAALPRSEKLAAEMKAKSGLSKAAVARLAGVTEARRTALAALAAEYARADSARPAAAPAPRDDASVMRALTRRALAGDTTAQLYAGQLALLGVGGPPDPGEARGWFEKAAQAGDRRGQFILGLMLEDSGGADAGLAWIQKAADQGLPAALTHLGLRLRQSDPAAARRLLGLAAAQDYHPAYLALTEMD